MDLRSPIQISEKLLEHDAIDIEDFIGPLQSLVWKIQLHLKQLKSDEILDIAATLQENLKCYVELESQRLNYELQRVDESEKAQVLYELDTVQNVSPMDALLQLEHVFQLGSEGLDERSQWAVLALSIASDLWVWNKAGTPIDDDYLTRLSEIGEYLNHSEMLEKEHRDERFNAQMSEFASRFAESSKMRCLALMRGESTKEKRCAEKAQVYEEWRKRDCPNIEALALTISEDLDLGLSDNQVKRHMTSYRRAMRVLETVCRDPEGAAKKAQAEGRNSSADEKLEAALIKAWATTEGSSIDALASAAAEPLEVPAHIIKEQLEKHGVCIACHP